MVRSASSAPINVGTESRATVPGQLRQVSPQMSSGRIDGGVVASVARAIAQTTMNGTATAATDHPGRVPGRPSRAATQRHVAATATPKPSFSHNIGSPK